MNNPAYYHLHHEDELEDLPFWLALAEELDSPILELGCGTGRLIIPLVQTGHDSVGLDINYQALTYLRSQISKQLHEQVKIFQSDMGSFHLARKFSLIFMACNTLSTLRQSKRQKVYLQVHDHLLENGVLAASIPNPAYLASLPSEGESELETSFANPLTGNPVQVSSGWKRFDRYIAFYWHYDHLLEDGHVERETIEIKQSLTSMEDYQEEFRAANLLPIKIFGDFEKSEYQPDSPYLIIMAKKGERF
jgi:SAM-dependent methyltransferase